VPAFVVFLPQPLGRLPGAFLRATLGGLPPFSWRSDAWPGLLRRSLLEVTLGRVVFFAAFFTVRRLAVFLAAVFLTTRRLAGLRAVVFFAAVFRAVRLFAGGTVTTFR
jgi:hypothetical protein